MIAGVVFGQLKRFSFDCFYGKRIFLEEYKEFLWAPFGRTPRQCDDYEME